VLLITIPDCENRPFRTRKAVLNVFNAEHKAWVVSYLDHNRNMYLKTKCVSLRNVHCGAVDGFGTFTSALASIASKVQVLGYRRTSVIAAPALVLSFGRQSARVSEDVRPFCPSSFRWRRNSIRDINRRRCWVDRHFERRKLGTG